MTAEFSASIPIAGSFPSSLLAGVGGAEVVSAIVGKVLVLAAFFSDSAASLELNDASTDAFSASIPIAGTFPFSVSTGDGAGEVVSEVIVGTSGEPVPLT